MTLHYISPNMVVWISINVQELSHKSGIMCVLILYELKMPSMVTWSGQTSAFMSP